MNTRTLEHGAGHAVQVKYTSRKSGCDTRSTNVDESLKTPHRVLYSDRRAVPERHFDDT
jgi:hypothetical protein